MALKEGQQAPAFTLQGSDGKTHALDDYSGTRLVIFFYPKDSTPGCTKEACGFRDAYSELIDMGIKLLGVSKDSLKSHTNFIAKYELPFPLLSDPETKMLQDYAAWGEKKLYGKTSLGCIRSTVLIDKDRTVIKHWPKVAKAAEHPQQVLSYIRELVDA